MRARGVATGIARGVSIPFSLPGITFKHKPKARPPPRVPQSRAFRDLLPLHRLARACFLHAVVGVPDTNCSSQKFSIVVCCEGRVVRLRKVADIAGCVGRLQDNGISVGHVTRKGELLVTREKGLSGSINTL